MAICSSYTNPLQDVRQRLTPGLTRGLTLFGRSSTQAMPLTTVHLWVPIYPRGCTRDVRGGHSKVIAEIIRCGQAQSTISIVPVGLSLGIEEPGRNVGKVRIAGSTMQVMLQCKALTTPEGQASSSTSSSDPVPLGAYRAANNLHWL